MQFGPACQCPLACLARMPQPAEPNSIRPSCLCKNAPDRFTALDRMLIAEQQGREFSDLRPDQDMRDTFRQNRALLIERARKLERMGLACVIETGKWIEWSNAEPVLRELGERCYITKTMHRALDR